MYLIGIDIGGTNVKYGLFRNKKLIDKYVEPTNNLDIIKQVVCTYSEFLTKNNLKLSDIDLVGVGFPGLVNNGKVLSSANLELNNCDLQKVLSKKLQSKVIVKNDVDMATLSEINIGAGKNVKNMVMLTVGTGIGGTTVIDGKIYEGNGAGEFGHITFEKGGKKCACGRRGCAEKYLSITALKERVVSKFGKYSSDLIINGVLQVAELENLYKSRDKEIVDIVEKYADDFSEYLLNICNLLRPDQILIGGGLSYAPTIVNKIADLCKIKGFGYPNAPSTRIKIAKLNNDSGIYGVLFVL